MPSICVEIYVIMAVSELHIIYLHSLVFYELDRTTCESGFFQVMTLLIFNRYNRLEVRLGRRQFGKFFVALFFSWSLILG